MCGRYFLDEESDAFQSLMERFEKEGNKLEREFQTKEVFPGGNCLVLRKEGNKMKGDVLHWGIPKEEGKSSLIINARSENLKFTKRFLAMRENPCFVVVNGYFEWDENKKKHYFENKNGLWYLKGIYDKESKNFVILTEESTRHFEIHSRQPLVYTESELLSSLN